MIHDNIKNLLFQFQLKLTERWINADTDSMEVFIDKFLKKNVVEPNYSQLKKEYKKALRELKKQGRLSDTTYIYLLTFANDM